MPRRNRESSHLSVEGWTNWIWAMAPENTTRVWNLKTRRNHQGYRNTNIEEELWEENDNVTRLCGIYEWSAIRSFGSDPIVVYVGSTCSRNGGPCTRMKNRIVTYCKHGNHKSDHINKALSRGFGSDLCPLEVRKKLERWRIIYWGSMTTPGIKGKTVKSGTYCEPR